MKKYLKFIVTMVLTARLLSGAAWDIRIPQQNTSGNAWPDRIVAPAANSLLGFAADKRIVNITAGANITITGNVISATGSGGSPVWSAVPASATASGTAGQMAYDGSYLYVCLATNLWSRAPLSEWTGSTGGGGGGGEWAAVPATATSTGTAGARAYDGSYLYVCVATNTWARFPLSNWP